MRTNTDPSEYARALDGIDFPASRDQLLNAARDKGGLDIEVIAMLDRLPQRTYQDAEDLRKELLQLYAANGPLANGGPAAPSNVSDAGKDVISAGADSRVGDIERPGQGGEDASRILARNRKLVDGDVDASTEGENEIGVGHMVNSDRSHVGDGGK